MRRCVDTRNGERRKKVEERGKSIQVLEGGGERREELREGERGEKVKRGRYLGNLFLYWLDIFLCEVSPHETHTTVDVKTNTT